MPVIQSDGCALNVVVDGNPNAPALILSSSLGTDHTMWAPQVERLAQQFHLVRYDYRGHGKSSVPPRPYTMDMLGRDALAIMDGLGIKTASWCGLSMGGMVGQWLGAHAPHRLERLILCNTTSYFPDKRAWNDRIRTVETAGMEGMAQGVAARWFTPGFTAQEPNEVARLQALVRATSPQGYIGCCEAIRDMDHREILHKISVPTLIIAGKHDVATSVESAEFLRDRIPGSKLVVLDAAHISNIEQADAFTAEVLGFFNLI
ncbi:MAG TPA: 3-oxoadipate enol-lactonase [Xanthobacteraceae bacterium]|nr:3-oxoadipate enol-lactonase [Xanthobacteraceae bacterium]